MQADNAIHSVIGGMAQRSVREIPIRPTDTIGEDGMYYCSICGMERTKLVKFPFGEQFVHCTCRCDAQRAEQARAAETMRARQDAIDELGDACFGDAAFRAATFEHSRITPDNKRAFAIAQRYVERFDEMLGRGQGLLLYGDTGSGKTQLASCIIHAVRAAGKHTVAATSLSRLLALSFERRELAEKRICKADLLLLDDLGAQRDTSFAAELCYRIVDERSRCSRPMIITTNLSMDELTKPRDIEYKRIYERLLERCYPLSLNCPSWRARNVKSKLGEVRSLLDDDQKL